MIGAGRENGVRGGYGVSMLCRRVDSPSTRTGSSFPFGSPPGPADGGATLELEVGKGAGWQRCAVRPLGRGCKRQGLEARATVAAPAWHGLPGREWPASAARQPEGSGSKSKNHPGQVLSPKPESLPRSFNHHKPHGLPRYSMLGGSGRSGLRRVAICLRTLGRSGGEVRSPEPAGSRLRRLRTNSG